MKSRMNKTQDVVKGLHALVVLLFIFSTVTASFGGEGHISAPAGFIRVEVASNSCLLVSMPFEPFNADLNTFFADQLIGATNEDGADRVLQWNAALQEYTISFKADDTRTAKDGNWFESASEWISSTSSISIGEAFWVENKHDGQSVFLMGSVLLVHSQEIAFVEGLNLFGSPYLGGINLNDSSLVLDGAVGATNIQQADNVIDALSSNTYWLLDNPGHSNDLKWHDEDNNPATLKLETGAAFWYDRIAAEILYWQELRPYSNLFSAGVDAPQVLALNIDTNLQSVILTVSCSGEQNETLEFFYKDLNQADSFTSGNGWQIADESIMSSGQTQISWTDSGSVNRIAITGVFCRIYLVGRQDMDSDSDDLSDAREIFVYQTADTDADTDDDGLMDGAEVNTFSTDPKDNDTDDDGMSDGAEAAWSADPTNTDSYTSLPWTEDFEALSQGDLDGQNGWSAWPTNSAIVQTGVVFNGNSALEFVDDRFAASAQHLFGAVDATNVWIDMQLKAVPGGLPDICDYSNRETAVVAVDGNGMLCGYDGLEESWAIATNGPVATGQWLHLTIATDYGAKTWKLSENGVLLLEELGFKNSAVNDFSMASVIGSALDSDYLDELSLTSTEPAHLDDDADGMPNIWERAVGLDVGTANAQEDPDMDGLTNIEEYQLSTLPMDADSDDDGVWDGTEMFCGTSPLQSNVFSHIPWSTGFETNDGYAVGNLDGQDRWSVLEGSVVVQTNLVISGQQTLSVGNNASGIVASTDHIYVGNTGSVVWTEMQIQMLPGILMDVSTNAAYLTAVFAVSPDGYLAGYDGLTESWNIASNSFKVRRGTWIHVAVKKDYSSRSWTLYRDGMPILRDIGFADATVSRFARIAVEGSEQVGSAVDDISIAENMPIYIDDDGDGLANMQEDANGNGIVDPGETDPEEADTDHDGMDDGCEIAKGFDPSISNVYTRLPWGTGFEDAEGYTAGLLDLQQNWRSSSSSIVQSAQKHTGTNAVEIAADDQASAYIARFIGAQNEDDVWIEMHAVLHPGQLPDPAGVTDSNSVLVAVNPYGELCAYHSYSQTWVTSEVEYDASSAEWTRLVFRLDYGAKTWALYLGSLIAFDDIPFLDEQVRWLSEFQVCMDEYNGNPVATLIDDIMLDSQEAEELDDDADGMYNAWERMHGLNANDPLDADYDNDADGLANLDEFLNGTDPNDADSDDDGIDDMLETQLLHSDPLVAEFTGMTVVETINGSDFTNQLGDWVADGTDVYSRKRRGYVEYDITSPTGDLYVLDIDITQHYSNVEPWNNIFDLLVYIDGEFVRRCPFFTPHGSVDTARLVTPWLSPGSHSVRIFWDNVYYETALQINELRLVELNGPDTDGDNVKDWVEVSLSANCSVDYMPTQSVVSPVCIEGAGQYLSKMSISDSNSVEPSVNQRWYADVPLLQSDVTDVAVSFQDGAYVLTNQIQWVSLNLLECSDELTVREGDSLLMTAAINGIGSGLIDVDGGGSLSFSEGNPAVYLFTNEGTYSVTVSCTANGVFTQRTVSVSVVGIPDVEAPACWRYRTREWTWNQLSSQIVVEACTDLRMEDLGYGEGNGRNFTFKLMDTDRDHYLVARAYADGPILESTKVDGFWWFAGVNGYILLVDFVDGKPLVEQRVATWNMPDTVDIELELFTAGTAFYPGMELELTVDKDDLDEMGEYTYQIILDYDGCPCCQKTYGYQGEVEIGSLYYSDPDAYGK